MASNSPLTRAQKQILIFSLLIIFLIAVLVYIFRDQGPAPTTPVESPSVVEGPTPEATYATVNEALDNLPTPTPVPTPTFAPTEAAAILITPTPTPDITIVPETYTTLRRNDAGAEVKRMQQRLIELGYLKKGGDDGDFGTGTWNAVKAFQRNNNLTSDGIAGPATLAALFSDNAKKAE